MGFQSAFVSSLMLLMVLRTVESQIGNIPSSQTFPVLNSQVFFPNQNFPPMTLSARPNTFVPSFGNIQQISNTGLPQAFGNTQQLTNIRLPQTFGNAQQLAKTGIPQSFGNAQQRANTGIPQAFGNAQQLPNTAIPQGFNRFAASFNNGFALNPMANIGTQRTFVQNQGPQGTGMAQFLPSSRNNQQPVQINQNRETGPLKAVAVLRGSTSDVTGMITFVQRLPQRNVLVSGNVISLLPGEHGFHIHELGDISEGCSSTGPHFNPYNVRHGNISDDVRHVGDLGNINVGLDGRAEVNIVDGRIQLIGPDSIIGRAVVVHAGRDDLGKYNNDGSGRHGNAGSRLACGVIGLSKHVDSG